MLLLIAHCSSAETIEVPAEESGAVTEVQIFRKDDTVMLQNAAVGTLPFFYGSSRGIDLSAIQWNQPVSGDNPGADCDLVYEKGVGSSHFFRCVIKEDKTHVILSLQEDVVNGRRLLRRVFVDGKGEEILKQWTVALERMGYTKSKAKVGGVTSRLISAKGNTLADLIWSSKTKSTTLRLTPKR